METLTPADVSAVVCTMNSIASIEQCLKSLRDAGVGELIVVDASSTDGTRAVADRLADRVVVDPGTGLGNARNVGIAHTTKALILNMGSDNIMPSGQLEVMIDALQRDSLQGVSARTRI
ncbi:MAG: glycosyltransferase family 2 protein, partial [Candidatus Nanopelagicales bacterium]|nr:glycosyltransferase family 2 protein [Candidatus Nanopelagicales bacterium]